MAFAFRYIVARIFPQEQVGLATSLINSAAMIAFVSMCGLDTTIMRISRVRTGAERAGDAVFRDRVRRCRSYGRRVFIVGSALRTVTRFCALQYVVCGRLGQPGRFWAASACWLTRFSLAPAKPSTTCS